MGGVGARIGAEAFGVVASLRALGFCVGRRLLLGMWLQCHGLILGFGPVLASITGLRRQAAPAGFLV